MRGDHRRPRRGSRPRPRARCGVRGCTRGAAGGAKPTGTTHVSVVDADGAVAALSSTLGSGSGVFRHGFQLNNMLGELDVIGHEPARGRDAPAEHDDPDACAGRRSSRLVIGSAGWSGLRARSCRSPLGRRAGAPGRGGNRSATAPRRRRGGPRRRRDGTRGSRTVSIEAGWGVVRGPRGTSSSAGRARSSCSRERERRRPAIRAVGVTAQWSRSVRSPRVLSGGASQRSRGATPSISSAVVSIRRTSSSCRGTRGRSRRPSRLSRGRAQ